MVENSRDAVRVEGAGVCGPGGRVGRRRQARGDAGAKPIGESVPQQRRRQAVDAGRLQAEDGGRFDDRVARHRRGHAGILRARRDSRACSGGRSPPARQDHLDRLSGIEIAVSFSKPTRRSASRTSPWASASRSSTPRARNVRCRSAISSAPARSILGTAPRKKHDEPHGIRARAEDLEQRARARTPR